MSVSHDKTTPASDIRESLGSQSHRIERQVKIARQEGRNDDAFNLEEASARIAQAIGFLTHVK